MLVIAVTACGGPAAVHSSTTATATSSVGTSSSSNGSTTSSSASGTSSSRGGCNPIAHTGSEATAYQIDATDAGVQATDAVSLPLCQRWSTDVGGQASYPLVSGGQLFVTVGQPQPNGQLNAVAFALDEASGAILWGPIDLGDTGRSDPTYDSGRVFVMTFTAHFLALDASTGAILWNMPMPDGQYLADAPPTAANGVVYAAASGIGETLYAFREIDGSLLWSQSVETADQDAPTVTADSVYGSYVCDDTYDFATADGGVHWEDLNHMGCGGAGGKTAPLADGKLFTRADEPMQTLDAATGSVLGTFGSMFIPAVAGGVMFTTPDYTLAAVPEGASTPTWTFGDPSTPIYGAPLVVEDQVVVGAGNTLTVLRASDGSVTSSTPLAAILGPDEQNASAPLAGLTEADGMPFAPAGTAIVAY